MMIIKTEYKLSGNNKGRCTVQQQGCYTTVKNFTVIFGTRQHGIMTRSDYDGLECSGREGGGWGGGAGGE